MRRAMSVREIGLIRKYYSGHSGACEGFVSIGSGPTLSIWKFYSYRTVISESEEGGTEIRWLFRLNICDVLRRSKSVPGIFPISDLHHLTTFLADPGRHLSFFLCRVESLQQPDLSSAQRDHQLLPAGEIRHLLQLIRPAAVLSDWNATTQIYQRQKKLSCRLDLFF